MAGPIIGDARQGRSARCSASQVGSGARRPRRRGADRLRHRPAARPAGQGRAGARQHRRRSPRVSTSPTTTSCSTSPCARPPTSGSSPHVPWLRDHLIGAVDDYAQGIEINIAGIQETMEERLRGVDPTNLEAMQEAMEGGLFDVPADSRQQKAALQRLEITLALVEGWVDEVVGQATAERMPTAAKLQEAVRRRRAAGGPAEQTFAALVGLELRPRRLRDASTLWGSLRTRQGAEARDAVWMQPRPAADRRRPRRPAGLPRGLGGARDAHRRRLRRRAARPARRRACGGAADGPPRARSEPPTPTRSPPCVAGRRPTPEQERAAGARTSPTSQAHPDGLARACLPRPPDRRRAGVSARTATQVLLTLHAQGRALVPASAATSSPVTPPSPAPRCARRPRSPGWPALVLDPVPVHLERARRAVLRPATATVHHLDVRFLRRRPAEAAPGGQRGVARRALVAGRRAADPEPDLVELVALARAALQSRLASTLAALRAVEVQRRPRARRPRGSPWPARRAGSGRPSAQKRALWPASSRWASSWTQHVVDHPGRHRLEPVGEPDRAVGRACTSPSGSLVVDPADRHGLGLAVEPLAAERGGPPHQVVVAGRRRASAFSTRATIVSTHSASCARVNRAGISTTIRSPSR